MKVVKTKSTASKINPSIKTFAQTLSDINNFDDMLIFLKDFLTESELETLSKRLAVSYWLKKGRSYSNITNNLKASSATISQVGLRIKTKGLIDALKIIEADEWANLWSKRIKRFVGR
jgi:TrpR-related protein YerC/YecD